MEFRDTQYDEQFLVWIDSGFLNDEAPNDLLFYSITKTLFNFNTVLIETTGSIGIPFNIMEEWEILRFIFLNHECAQIHGHSHSHFLRFEGGERE